MIQIAIMGLGTVGTGVAKVVAENARQIERKLGEPLQVKTILVRHFKDGPYRQLMTDDFTKIEEDHAIRVVVETIGGVEAAYEYTKRALNAGKHVVTANKQLVAEKGAELLALAKKRGVNYLFEASVGGGILLAIAAVLIIWVILNKTTFGYELKAVGLNKNAARYAGINEKKNIILSMTIAGALAGFGAGLYYLSAVSEWNPLNSTSLPAIGFNGISVALLASSNPLGVIFSALFISHISVGGAFLSTKYYPTEVADLISGIIIYLCAFSMLFRGKIHTLLFKHKDKTNVNAEPAPAEKPKEGK